MEAWDDLKFFLSVARAGTLTGAATELGVSVSTLHRHLNALEAEVGTTLFEKGPRGYQLTNAGEALLPRAEEVEEAVFAASRAVVGHDQQAAGEVRFTLPLALVPMIAPHLAEFSRQCSGVRPILQADDTPLDLHRETDLALRATTRPVDSAVGRNLFAMAWGRYAGADTEGEAMPWIYYVGMDHAEAIQWRKKHHADGCAMMSVQGVIGMHSVLAATGAQGMLPCFVGDWDPALRRIGEPVASSRLWLLVHADLRRSARVRALIDFLVPRLLVERNRFEGILSPG